MSEYDQRQYRRMRDALAAFEKGDLPPGILLAELEGFLGVLEKPEASWAREFQNGLGGLDEDIADAIVRLEDEGDSASNKELSFDEETTKRLRATAARLMLLVLAKIDGPVGDSKDID